MNRYHFTRALTACAIALLASVAYAQGGGGSGAQPAKAEAHRKGGAEEKPKTEARGDEKSAAAKTERARDSAGGSDPAAPGKAKGADLSARRTAEHAAQRERLERVLRRPMDEAMKQELRQHARRVARIERIKEIATEASDKDAVARADKLLEREKGRHEKWMTRVGTETAAMGGDK